MKAKGILLFTLGGLILLSTSFKDVAVAQKIESNKNIIRKVLKLAKNSTEDSSNEDPDFVFEKALEGYNQEFDSYLNVIALNAEDKEGITLPGFDPNYIAPSYADIMYKYQTILENSLSSYQFDKYEQLRQKSYDFDRYVTLNLTKYQDLNVKTRYPHRDIDDIFNPIKPPVTGPGNGIIKPPVQGMSFTSATAAAGLVAILTSAGLSKSVIAAFTGAVSTMYTGLSTSWIPFVGWALAVALVVGALIAITAIIVLNWDKIVNVFNEIKNWFLNEFSKFASFINSFFGDAEAKGKKTKIVGKNVIGGKEITWKAKGIRNAVDASFVELLKDIDYVLLMRNIKKKFDSDPNIKYTSFWLFEIPVPVSFIISTNLYDFGISTYTFLMMRADYVMRNGSSYMKNQPKNLPKPQYELAYHNFVSYQKHSFNGFDHFHVYEYRNVDGIWKYDKILNKPINKAHSFFGPMYYRTPNGIKSY